MMMIVIMLMMLINDGDVGDDGDDDDGDGDDRAAFGNSEFRPPMLWFVTKRKLLRKLHKVD